jgi:hypothetical protein
MITALPACHGLARAPAPKELFAILLPGDPGWCRDMLAQQG